MKSTFGFLSAFIFTSLTAASGLRNENLFKLYSNEIEKPQLTALQTQALSFFEISTLVQTPNTSTGVTFAQGEKIYNMILRHPIVSPYMERVYDPNDELGFCFGRALFVHLELLGRGVNRSDIRKAFVIGPMFAENLHWSFHVATTVRGKDGKWWVIDSPPFGNGVVELEEWYKHQLGFSEDGKLRLYLTNPQQFTPTQIRYTRGVLQETVYRNYFEHLLEEFRMRFDLIEKFSHSCKYLF